MFITMKTITQILKFLRRDRIELSSGVWSSWFDSQYADQNLYTYGLENQDWDHKSN